MKAGTPEYFRAKSELAEWCGEQLDAMKEWEEKFLLTPRIEDILWTEEEIKAEKSFIKRLAMGLRNMGWEPGVNLLWIAKFHQWAGVPIKIERDRREGGYTIFGPRSDIVRRSKPINFPNKLYNINHNTLMAMGVQGPCIYANETQVRKTLEICYFDDSKNYTCPIGPLCKAYENVEDIG